MSDFTGTDGNDSWSGTDAVETASGGAGDDTLSGNGGNDTLNGGEGSDTLDGGHGADVLRGGLGDDIYVVDGFDTIEEIEDAGRDEVRSALSYTLGANFDALVLTGTLDVDGTGNDLLNGLYGNAGNNVLSGLGGSDFLFGYEGDDTLFGGDGNDLLWGSSGNDILDGGAGNDLASYRTFGTAGVIVDLSIAGPQDTIGAGIDTLVSVESVEGTEFADILRGDDRDNVIEGVGGLDVLEGRGGNDQYYVRPGAQIVEDPFGGDDYVVSYGSFTLPDNVEHLTIVSNDGASLLGVGNSLANSLFAGSTFATELHGGDGDDLIVGDAGEDILAGEGGDDTVYGRAGMDSIAGGDGNDYLFGEEGNDTIHGDGGSDAIYGDGGNDGLYGDAGNDILDGGIGDDWLEGGTGVDIMRGGTGEDQYVVEDAADLVYEIFGEGAYDRVWSSITYALPANVELLNLTGSEAIDGYGNDLVNTLSGNSAANYLFGGAGDDGLSGFGGDDVLEGGEGRDTLTGGDGADVLRGGPGDDIYYIDALDTILETADGGSEQIWVDHSYTLGTNLEHLSFYGSADANGTGNEYRNTLWGNSGSNILSGLGGIDHLYGWDGDDILYGGDGDDVLQGGAGTDVLDGGAGARDQASYWFLATAGVTVSLAITGFQDTGGAGIDLLAGIEDLQGTIYNDILIGNDSNNVISGVAGQDTYEGRGGDDTYYIINSLTQIIEQSGGGIDQVFAYGESYTLPDHVEVLRIQSIDPSVSITGRGNSQDNVLSALGPNAITLYGGGGNDTLNGREGADSLLGEAGNDTLNGGDGDDVLSGNDGDDTLNGGSGNNLLSGDAGNDILYDGLGNNVLDGGAGNDSFVVGLLSGYSSEDQVRGGSGYDTLFINSPDPSTAWDFSIYQVASDIEALVAPSARYIMTTAQAGQFDRLELTSLLLSTGGAVVATPNFRVQQILMNNAGNVVDLTDAPLLNFSVFGRAGNDVFYDGPGNDAFTGDAGSDSIFLYFGQGFSTADQISGGSDYDEIRMTGLPRDTWIDYAAFQIAPDIESFSSETGDGRLIMSVERANEFDRLEFAGLMFSTGGTFVATANFRVGDIHLSDAGNTIDLRNAAAYNYTISGGSGDDTIITGGALTDTVSGGGGADVFRGSASQLNGDTITDFAVGDRIWIDDATSDSLTFSLSSSGVLTFSGGTMTLTGVTGTLVASAAAGGGVQLSLVPPVFQDVRNDFNGDGRSDVLWRNASNGTVTDWLGQANGGFFGNGSNAYINVPGSWHIVGTGDFNGDGRDDVLWRNDNGTVTNWLGQANGGFFGNGANAYINVPASWHIVGTGDFNGDGRDDVLWRNNNGTVTEWLGQANGGFADNGANAYINVPASWHIVGTGDFNGDGRDDVLWRNDNGTVTEWLGQANGGFANNGANAYINVPASWHIVGTGDYNGDGRDDVLWRHDNGTVTDWMGQANGGFLDNGANAYINVATSWQIQGPDNLFV